MIDKDKELLELAAKACGLEEAKMRIEFNQWNPIEDDGDALRLAVKLGMNIHYPTMIGSSQVHVSSIKRVEEKLFEDPYAATRRAITRAAAEIGRSMK
jgi:hypothetical protein